MLYYNQTVQANLKSLNTNYNGLSSDEANKRLYEHGANSITIQVEPLWRKLLEPFMNVFMLVLSLAAIISLFQGDNLDAVIVVVIMSINALVYYVQRFSTERVLRSLQKHNSQNVEALRDNAQITVDATSLVPGDIILLSEGDKVPADGRLITGHNVRTDESLLTGESEPINKISEPLKGTKEIYEQSNILFQGSFVVSGEATLVVTSTGNHTEFGQIAALASTVNTKSPIQTKIDKLIGQIVAVVAGLAVVAFILAQLNDMGLAESLRFVMALSVSAVPESLPVAISVVLVLGIRRMAAKNALIRNMSAIETIGSLTTIATDKTGTLTKNKLAIQQTWLSRGITDKQFSQYLAETVLSNGHKSYDPLDIAISEYVKHDFKSQNSLKTSLPFDQSVAMSGNIWGSSTDRLRLTVKGAPENIIAKSDLTENEREESTAALHHLTSKGYRVIAVAETKLSKSIDQFSDLPAKTKFEFMGFIAISDILRPEAKKAIATARAAGVTVRMITGDHFETAYHIGRELGIVTSRSQVFDTRKMNIMSDEELELEIEESRIFSRVTPEHKYRILALLKKHNITAMTGDGVNDVPALSNAHVGITMGSGTQIAKDAGDIILLDDNFKSIIDAMREGRTIVSNIGRMLFYLLSTNAGEAMTMIGALVCGLPIPLAPVQILWVNLVTDTAMVIPLGLEPGEKDSMKRKPNLPNAPILPKDMVIRMIIIATSIAILTLSMYVIYSNFYGQDYGRTIAFNVLVVMQLANAFNARSDYESALSRLTIYNSKFYAGLTIAVTLHILAVLGPLQPLLHVTTVAVGDLFVSGIIAFTVPIVLAEIHKYFCRRARYTSSQVA